MDAFLRILHDIEACKNFETTDRSQPLTIGYQMDIREIHRVAQICLYDEENKVRTGNVHLLQQAGYFTNVSQDTIRVETCHGYITIDRPRLHYSAYVEEFE